MFVAPLTLALLAPAWAAAPETEAAGWLDLPEAEGEVAPVAPPAPLPAPRVQVPDTAPPALAAARDALARAPLDPARRLALAHALADLPGEADLAVEVLRPLLAEPAVAVPARELLHTLLLREPPRATWSRLYAPAGASDVLHAEALARAPASRLDGIRRLEALAVDEPAASAALGRAHLDALDPVAALADFGRADDATGATMAALAAGDDVAAGAWGPRAKGPLGAAAASGDPLRAALALRGAGRPDLAVLALEAHDASDPDALVLLGTLRLQTRSWAAAETAFRAAAAERADDPVVRQGLGHALLAQGHADEAARWLGETARPVLAARALAAAAASPDPGDDRDAAERAFALDPGDPDLAARVGYGRLEAGHAAEAAGPLAVALAARPSDPQLAGAYVAAAAAAGHLDDALVAVRTALALAAPDDQEGLNGALASTLLLQGEARKVQADPHGARTAILTALAVHPEDPAVLHAAGGLLWSQAELEGAAEAYGAALALDPDDEAARLACAGLAGWLGQTQRMDELLAALPADDVRVLTLRGDFDRESRSRLAWADLQAGRVDEARAAFTALAEADPRAPGPHLGLAELRLREGDANGALEEIHAARRLAPDDPWPRLAEANLRMVHGEPDLAATVLTELGDDVPPEVGRERDRARARLLRLQAARERDAGRLADARARYTEAAALDTDPWNVLGLAGVALQEGDAEGALALYDQLSDDPIDPDLRREATRGRAAALEALGRAEDAVAALEDASSGDPAEDLVAEDAVRVRAEIQAADALRRDGDLAQAARRLEALAEDHGDSPAVRTALAALRLDQGRPRDAVREAGAALSRAPHDPWALETALAAAASCGCTAEVLHHFEADAATGDPDARRRLGLARAQTAAEAAADEVRRHRRAAARALLDEARDHPGLDADALVVLARAYRLARGPRGAEAALREALRLEPGHAEATLALANLLAATLRAREAERLLAANAAVDPALAVPLARAHLARGESEAAVTVLQGIDTPYAESLRARAEQHALAEVAPGAGVLRRSGQPGLQLETAIFTPLAVGGPAGPGRWQVEAVAVQVDNGAQVERGVALSGAWTGPPDAPLSGSVRLGTSPHGFVAGLYPTWNLGVGLRLPPSLFFGVETARVPLQDSLASWAGQRDPLTGEVFGSASFTWVGARASVSGARGPDAGVLGRVGAVGGVGFDANPRQEAVAWGGWRLGDAARGVRFGVEGVYAGNERQVDGFGVGEGGYYSPPSFGLGLGGLEGRWHTRGGHLGVCATARAGVQHASGDDSPWFASGTLFAHNGQVQIVGDLGGRWRFTMEGSWLAAGPVWHQEAALLHLGFGPEPGAPGPASPLSTFAFPGAGIVSTGDPC